MTDLQTATSITREDAALRTIAKATKRMRQFEQDAGPIFAEYAAAQDTGREVGFTFDLELSPGMAAFYSDWKQRNAVRDARELSRADWHAVEA